MPIENLNIHEMVETAQADNEPEVASRESATRGKSIYVRKALVRIFSLTPERRCGKACGSHQKPTKGCLKCIMPYRPKNGFEEAALAELQRTLLLNGTGTTALKNVIAGIGETIDKREEQGKGNSGNIFNHIPVADRKPLTN